MDEARTTRQLSLSWNLGLAMTFLALMGWGTAYFARASTAVQQQLREEVAQLKVTQDQLLAERDQARGQLAATQQEVMVLAAAGREPGQGVYHGQRFTLYTSRRTAAHPSQNQRQGSIDRLARDKPQSYRVIRAARPTVAHKNPIEIQGTAATTMTPISRAPR